MVLVWRFAKGIIGMTLGLAGCATVRGTAPVSIDQTSPKALLASFHEAVEAENYAAQLECVAPRFQGAFDWVLVNGKKLKEKQSRLERLIRSRIGPDEADWYGQQQSRYGVFPSPLAPAVQEALVDWKRIAITVKGNKAWVQVRPSQLRSSMEMINGKWYLTPFEEAGRGSKIGSYLSASVLFDGFARQLRELEGDIRAGRINKENFWGLFGHADVAQGGPPVSGVSIVLAPRGLIAYRKNDPLRFVVIVWEMKEDVKVCWLIPQGGLGENVTVELDGAAIPQPAHKATRAVGAGDEALDKSWCFTLPEDVRPSPGWHTLRYKVSSQRGTYTTPAGEKIPHLEGQLVSNRLRFLIRREDKHGVAGQGPRMPEIEALCRFSSRCTDPSTLNGRN